MRTEKKAVYSISVVAELTGFHQQTIRQYERLGLVSPERSPGGTRRFAQEDVERLQSIGNLTQQMGVNLAGVELILKMREREQQLIQLAREMFGQLDEAARMRLEAFLRGSEPGLVPVGQQGIQSLRRQAGQASSHAEDATAKRRIAVKGE